MSSFPSMARQVPWLKRLTHWLDAMPHPALVCEIAATHVAVARTGRAAAGVESHALEILPEGVVAPSPVEQNIANADAVRDALRRALNRIHGAGPEAALLVPDQVVRVFLLHFDTLPRSSEEAIPLLRWRLKKSVPFDVEDTVVSYLAQPPRDSGVDVLAAVARMRVIRQYEEQLEALGVHPGVVLGSTLATLPLLDENRTTLLARLTGSTLTTVIVRGDLLCVYRCTQMPAGVGELEPQALLDEVYPAVAYFQDTWQESIQLVRLAGFAPRFDEFRRALESELACTVSSLASSSMLQAAWSGDAKTLVDRQLDALVGWAMNRGA